ncbi:enolase C-terminal domain-like protein [Polycladidibacter hongkongensis]|uniref:enolase C-terminal domain-like protein n=1 Tax=Polycladidibacter hongkongensis TaxID=1647556 RepID=UPI00082DB0DA|nr:enolase C-terminal domain-like protein [Pseudovibrio hongkongensis]
MKITGIDIRSCRHEPDTDHKLKDGRPLAFEFLVLKLKTDEGIEIDTFGFGGRAANAMGQVSEDVVKPFFLGRDTAYREQNWHEFRKYNRAWNFAQSYVLAPFDIACWLAEATAADLPLYKYLGAYRDAVPIYGSSLTLDSAEAYAAEALRLKNRGWAAYKLHPPADNKVSVAAHIACREAVGPDFKLMSDPVGNMNFQQNLAFGKLLQDLDYYWLEEAHYDEASSATRELARSLHIPIVGGECSEHHPGGVAELIASRAIDIVRADASWSGGVTPMMKTAHLAEAFAMNCEIHTAIYHPLELVNLHCAAAMKNCEFFEVLVPEHLFNIGLKEDIHIENGMAHLPQKPGLGIDLDWDFIDNCTQKVF